MVVLFFRTFLILFLVTMLFQVALAWDDLAKAGWPIILLLKKAPMSSAVAMIAASVVMLCRRQRNDDDEEE